MWANGGWLCSWDGFSRGYTLVASAGRVPADPWNMLANAKLCFTVFHGIAPSNGLVMSEVAKSRWHDNWVFITFLFCMLTPALAWLRTWVTLKITFMTKEGGGCENNGGICSLDEKNGAWTCFGWVVVKMGKGGVMEYTGLLVSLLQNVSHRVAGLPMLNCWPCSVIFPRT